MKRFLLNTFLGLMLGLVILQAKTISSPEGFVEGTVALKSVSSLTFNEEGILFVGDPMAAMVYAIDVKDNPSKAGEKGIQVRQLDQKIAAMLGVKANDIRILDMAVNPVSQQVYLSVRRAEMPLLLKVDTKGEISEVSLQKVMHSKTELSNPIDENAERRGRKLRNWAITDLNFSDGKLFIAGLSNEEFASTFRVIPFPFKEDQKMNSIEIYHAAHGRYETNSPIKTFMTYPLNNEPHIIASYTCTPLVTFPVSSLTGDSKVKGKTVAELGNRNTPLDLISFKKNGEDKILLANSNRTMMMIDPDDIIAQKESLTERVERHGVGGVKFLAVAEIGVQQLDNLNDDYIILLQRSGNGDLNLRSVSKKRL